MRLLRVGRTVEDERREAADRRARWRRVVGCTCGSKMEVDADDVYVTEAGYATPHTWCAPCLVCRSYVRLRFLPEYVRLTAKMIKEHSFPDQLEREAAIARCREEDLK